MTRTSPAEAGFTLIELTMVTVLMTLVGALGLTAIVNYQRAADLEGSANDLVSALRTTAQRSITEGRTYCVHLDPATGSHTVYRFSCATTSPVVVPAKRTRGPAVLATPSFAPAVPARDVCLEGNACAYFYPRGTASPGQVLVQRPGGKSITVEIQGLTSRVFIP